MATALRDFVDDRLLLFGKFGGFGFEVIPVEEKLPQLQEPAAGGALVGEGDIQTVWLSAPIFCFATTLMILYVYIVSLQDQVSIDDLTHLNNRAQLKKYIVSESGKPGGDKANRYILMIDLNKFKEINDQYGHVEGDYALRRTADALRAACAANNELKTFIARYGGDEFIIVARTDDESRVKELCSNIKAEMVRLNGEAGAKYELTASIGYSCYCGDVFAFQNALAKADEALYKDKKATR